MPARDSRDAQDDLVFRGTPEQTFAFRNFEGPFLGVVGGEQAKHRRVSLRGDRMSRLWAAVKVFAELPVALFHQLRVPTRHDAPRLLHAHELKGGLRGFRGLARMSKPGEELGPERKKLGPGLRPFSEESIDPREDLFGLAASRELDLQLPVAVQVWPVGRYPGGGDVRAFTGSPADVFAESPQAALPERIRSDEARHCRERFRIAPLLHEGQDLSFQEFVFALPGTRSRLAANPSFIPGDRPWKVALQVEGDCRA